MDNLIDVLVPAFINPHLFWIIPRKDILLRTAIHRTLSLNRPKKVDSGLGLQMEVAVNINGTWARGVTENILENSNVTKFFCFLPDYGTRVGTHEVYNLPSEVRKCPCLAKQASLFNVVNLMTELKLGSNGYEVGYSKTINNVDGVNKFALNCLEEAQEVYFKVLEEDEFNVYGDLILFTNGKKKSLTKLLIDQQLLAEDEEMFNFMEPSRIMLKEQFYQLNSSQVSLKLAEKLNLSKILFNKTKNQADRNMEVF